MRMNIELTEMQIDIIKELMNVGVNESTNILSQILNTEIELNIPKITFCQSDELMDELTLLGSEELTAVNMKYKGEFSGTSQLVFSQESANKIVEIFSLQMLDNDDIEENKSGAMIEIGNIVLNAVLAEFSNFFKDEFEFYIPDFYENYKSEFYRSIDDYSDNIILLGRTIFSINQFDITGDIIIFMKIESFNTFIELINKYIKEIQE
jgi:chemotaxis protein CheC